MAEVRQALEGDDLDLAAGVLERLRSQDQADVFTELDDEDQVALLPHLDPTQSADILEDLDDQDAAELISALSTETATSIVDEMEPDEAADVLGAITRKQADEIMTNLEDPEEVRPLLVHPSDSAGGLMTSDFLAFRRRMTASEALKAIHEWSPPPDTAYNLFVVDQHGRLCGVVGLRGIIVAKADMPLSDIMNPDVISVPVGTDQEECAKLMRRYDLLALPVIDDNHVLLGIITIDDVIGVQEEEATEDIQRLGGAEPLNQPYLSSGVFSIFRKRVWWLLLLFIRKASRGVCCASSRQSWRA